LLTCTLINRRHPKSTTPPFHQKDLSGKAKIGKSKNMNTANRTTPTTKSAGPQVVREAAEAGAAQTTQAFEQVNAATSDATALMKDSYTTAMKRTQDYNAKLFEFAQKNTEAAFEFVRELSSVKSPTEFLELSGSHSRKQFEALTEQTRELATLAQKAALATVGRIEKDVRQRS
jgi:phasin